MLFIQLAQDLLTWAAASVPDGHFWQTLLTHPSLDFSLLAQQQFDTDVFAGARNAFDNFVQSGQVWALIIGLVLGYFIRSLTTYG